MNSQDLRNLQEAYIDVYQLDEDLIQYPWGYVTKQIERKKKSGDKSYKELQRRHERLRELTSNELGKPGHRLQGHRLQDSEKTQKEQVDLYDIILSHLLDEGYADTQEQAEVIMVNMSEDWRESIIEENENNKMTRLDKKDLRNKKFLKNSPYGEIAGIPIDKRRVDAHDARRGVKTKKK